ncbi:hypothetical protein E4U53_002143 [Claviceps sorghi]|nr:hypothetical protein E4U53_002143 [Claviceps sorghi]
MHPAATDLVARIVDTNTKEPPMDPFASNNLVKIASAPTLNRAGFPFRRWVTGRGECRIEYIRCRGAWAYTRIEHSAGTRVLPTTLYANVAWQKRLKRRPFAPA